MDDAAPGSHGSLRLYERAPSTGCRVNRKCLSGRVAHRRQLLLSVLVYPDMLGVLQPIGLLDGPRCQIFRSARRMSSFFRTLDHTLATRLVTMAWRIGLADIQGDWPSRYQACFCIFYISVSLCLRY